MQLILWKQHPALKTGSPARMYFVLSAPHTARCVCLCLQVMLPSPTWVIGPEGATCSQACNAQGLGCSDEEMQGVDNKQEFMDIIGSAMPGLTCASVMTGISAEASPALNAAANTCATNGAGSTCGAAPGASVQRLW